MSTIVEEATPHAVEAYAPEPSGRRKGIGLCLSGGGFRATLFHLGAVRRLNELAILPQITTISSVSGGSIIAAHLANAIAWPIAEPVADFETRIAQPLRKFTRQDIRTRAVLKGLLPFLSSVELLASRYEDLTKQKVAELPLAPRFIFCSTDMAYGVNFIFERERMGDYQIGYVSPPPGEWTVARAVAASSCFPPVFNPMPVVIEPSAFKGGSAPKGDARDACIRRLRLTDGGNYDNMGLEPVWKDHRVVLVSDGGGTFDSEGDRNLVQRLLRYTAIVDRQALALRKRWLISSFLSGAMKGAYWGIASKRSSYGASGGYGASLVQDGISEMRTDLDTFSEEESAVLENHGYLLADAAASRHLRESIASAPLNPPFPDLLDEGAARKALATSHKRQWFGR